MFKRRSREVSIPASPIAEVVEERSYLTGSITVSETALIDRLRFHGLTEADLGVIATWRKTCEQVTDALVDQFYAHIRKQSVTQAILDKHTTVDRQRPRLTRYVLTMFAGKIDDTYIEYRRVVGRIHDDIDLDSNWYVAMYEIIRRVLVDAVVKAGANEKERHRFETALQRLIQVDIALVTTALTDSRMDKIEALKQEQSETMHTLVENLIGAAKAGNLDTRMDPEAYTGDVRDFVTALNAMLDAIIQPIQESSRVLELIAGGNLTERVRGDYKGDHALMKNAVNAAANDLSETLAHVKRTVAEVLAGSTQVADASQALSEGASEQASNLEEINATLEEITNQTGYNADNATQANSLVQATSKRADEGNQRMSDMLDAMQRIDEASSQISRIIKVIDEIAFQTNLLALNAAVEAARAGVHGKGFAVVAEEVRSLATRSAQAAKETTSLIEETVSKVRNGHSLAQDTAGVLGDIVTSVTKVADLVGEIASASGEQSNSINEINRALSQVGEVTQGNAANAEQSAAASEQLSSQANELNYMLEHFRISNQIATQPMERRRATNNAPNRVNGPSKSARPAQQTSPRDIIDLDDDMGRF